MKERITSFIVMSLLALFTVWILKSAMDGSWSGYWYVTSTEKTDPQTGERYLYVNDSVKVIYLKKDSLKHYKGQMIVLSKGKVMADMWVQLIPNKYLMLDWLNSEYNEKLKITNRRKNNFLND